MNANYFAQLITFLAALLAIKGGTWDENANGLKKITRVGYFVAILAAISFFTSLFITYNSRKDSESQSEKLAQAVAKTSIIESQLDQSLENEKSIREEAAWLRSSLEAAQSKIEGYKSILETIRAESIRQPQQVMAQYVKLYPRQEWIAPNHIYGGSIVKLYGFQDNVLVFYGMETGYYYADKIQYLVRQCNYEGISNVHGLESCLRGQVKFDIVRPERNGHSEIAIIGYSGERMSWGLLGLSGRRDSGKVFVESTPRIRSENWSWIEEARDSIETINKIIPNSKVKVVAKSLNLRDKPNRKSSILGSLVVGDKLTVKKREDLWLNVENEAGNVGWIHGGYVELLEN